MPAQARGPLSDRGIDLVLRQTVWGSGGIAARVLAAPDPDRQRGYWTGLTLYRWATPAFRAGFDKALEADFSRHPWTNLITGVIQAKRAMMAAPGDYPFCLDPVQFREKCQALFGGQIDGSDYTPPNAYRDAAKMVLKAIGATALVAGAAALLPEEALAGLAIYGVSGTAAARSVAIAAGNVVLDHLLPTANPLDSLHQSELWRRYQVENLRRKLP